MDPANLSIAFGIWAAVVGLIGLSIRTELSRLRTDVKEMAAQLQAYSKELHDYTVTMERRVATIEAHMTIKHADFRAHTGG